MLNKKELTGKLNKTVGSPAKRRHAKKFSESLLELIESTEASNNS
jgi:hypothetical protein